MAKRSVALDQVADHLNGFVGRVVENLNIQLVLRIFQPADAINQAVGDILLVEHRQLHGDARKVLKISSRLGRALVAMLVIKINEDVAVHAVGGEQNQDDEIRNQQPDV